MLQIDTAAAAPRDGANDAPPVVAVLAATGAL
jgi:hypothetical protein